MADSTEIEWTDSTWNPVTGCSKVSAGCDFCYAERFAERFGGVKGHPFEHGFDLTLRPARLTQPLQWRQPRRIFVNSMSDLFHKNVPTVTSCAFTGIWIFKMGIEIGATFLNPVMSILHFSRLNYAKVPLIM